MQFFIVKKPLFIDFNMEKLSETVSLKGKHQILFDGTSSNSSLVKMKDGNWYVRYGKTLLKLKSVDCKEMTIGKIQNNQGELVESVNKKWILQNTGNI